MPKRGHRPGCPWQQCASVHCGVPTLTLLEGQVGMPEGQRKQNDLGSVYEGSFPKWSGNPF